MWLVVLDNLPISPTTPAGAHLDLSKQINV
jgi:hypothetical protein